jgi:soluble lytic murein transglycosylase
MWRIVGLRASAAGVAVAARHRLWLQCKTMYADPLRPWPLRRGLTLLALAAGLAWPLLAPAQPGAGPVVAAGDRLVLDAREALRRGDARALAEAQRRLEPLAHPLAAWVDYWALQPRLREVTADEVEAVLQRWRGSFVEHRLRVDWLLELGRRRDWVGFERELARLARPDGSRELACYALVAEHLQGRERRAAARAAWLAQREADDGCHLLARTLLDAGVFTPADVWARARLLVEQQREAAARQAVALVAPRSAAADWWGRPKAVLDRRARERLRPGELDALAIARLAASDPDRAAQRLEAGLGAALPAEAAAWAWGQTARWSALRLQPQALDRYAVAAALARRTGSAGVPVLSDDTWAWQLRAALRAQPTAWARVREAVAAMSEAGHAEAAWVYWDARAALALAPRGAAGDAARAAAQAALEGIAARMDFYGKLAAEALGRSPPLPPAPPPLTRAELAAAQQQPGLARALHLLALGLRSEGVREWNFSLHGLSDRELRAAAQLACAREVWDRCIHASERTRDEIDLAQRFPMPFRDAVVEHARASGVDPALVFGLIRQESRFVREARSPVGASGLMQLMPATARTVAQRLGIGLTPQTIDDLDTNLALGTAYLRQRLDDFGGSAPLAAAAYNAGPAPPRRWRAGPPLEPAMWAETIPFGETRDYVKKVLSNAAYYAVLLRGEPLVLGARLGPAIGAPATPVAPPAAQAAARAQP